MSVRLLDVNVLISILDSAHVHHAPTLRWFTSIAVPQGWATCPITENGFIRIVSSVNYPNLSLSPAGAAASLGRFKSAFPRIHQFWPGDLSLTDESIFDLTILAGSSQTTDAWLAGLAFKHKARLATLDSAVAWRAVRGGSAALLDRVPV